MGYRNGDVHRSLVVLANSFWVHLSALFLPLFRAVHKLFLRYEEAEDPPGNSLQNQDTVISSSVVAVQDREKSSMVSVPVEAEEPKAEPDTVESSVLNPMLDELDEMESPELFLSFKFPSFEEFAGNSRFDNNLESVSRQSLAKEEVLNCNAKELASDGNFNRNVEILAEEVPVQVHDCHDYVVDSQAELLQELKSHVILDKILTKEFRFQVLSEKDLLVSDSDADSMSSSHDFSVMSRLLDSNNDRFLSGGDFDGDLGLNRMGDSDEDDDRDLRKELRTLEYSKHKQEEEEKDKALASDDHSSENLTSHSSEDTLEENEDSKLEVEWEHQDLIEQLRMEIRKVKATGLPTIAEEDSESPRIMDDLKLWRIDDGLHGGDQISEIHKVYRSYRERMRKLDILNYQKMYALGFLRVKDTFKSISSQKSSTPSLASLIPQARRMCRENKRSDADPVINLVRELYDDLETVYVGQMCLSWEFLHWQYEKALELWEADPYSVRRYNEVANEFQQLQVLMERFLENEQFEGPRVRCYVKNRCFLGNLLQVPVIREDNLKVRRKIRVEGKSEFGVSSDVLVEILEESIWTFWRFIRADKDANNSIQKARKAFRPELQDPADSELFSELQGTLQKKEKKLKELLKGGNCIRRMLQRWHHRHDQEDRSSSDQALAFFSLVDMKLVRRVLSMSRLSTDQLAWCSSKLSRNNFTHRKIHVEPSFLLFPC